MVGKRLLKNIYDDNSSSIHHWWPLGLQKYWTDREGEFNVIYSDKSEDRIKPKKRSKFGSNRQSHTMNKDIPGARAGFEGAYKDVDNSASEIIDQILSSYRPWQSDIQTIGKQIIDKFKNGRTYENSARYIQLDPAFSETLFKYCLSLLIRSPAKRKSLENYYQNILDMDDPASEKFLKDNKQKEWFKETGKVNLYHETLNWLDTDVRHSDFVFFAFIWSCRGEFIYGDGLYDKLSSCKGYLSVGNEALIPLTPEVCVYCFSVQSVFNGFNCLSIYANPITLEEINGLTQIYSKRCIAYRYSKPKFNKNFFKGNHMYVNETLGTLNAIKKITGQESIPKFWYV